MDPRLVDHDKLRAEMRAQDRKRHAHPDRDPELAQVSVVYVWHDDAWQMVNFVRTPKTITPKILRRIRRRSGVTKHFAIMLRELWLVERDGDPTTPPQRFATTRPTEIAPDLPLPRQVPSPKARRVTRDRSTHLDPETVYVAFGLLRDKRANKPPLYLGPLQERTYGFAKREAQRQFGALYDVRIAALKELPKGLRKRLRNGRILPGITYIVERQPNAHA